MFGGFFVQFVKAAVCRPRKEVRFMGKFLKFRFNDIPFLIFFGSNDCSIFGKISLRMRTAGTKLGSLIA